MPTSTLLYFAGILVAIISIVLSINVNAKFKKWSKVQNMRSCTGKEVAERMLHNAGIYDVSIELSQGRGLSDHYDPKAKSIRLSENVYQGTSIAAAAVAAHECGHAIQHANAYSPLSVRSALLPVANIGSRAGYWLFFIGIAFVYIFETTAMLWLVDLGIVLFAACVAFHFITLPIEFNASSRALSTLLNTGILAESEIGGAKQVLSAAAMTYVAAAAAAIIQLLRLIAVRNND